MFARLLVFCSCVFHVLGLSCYWNNKCTYTNYGSKTIYDDVRGDLRDTPELEGCHPIGVWALMRHGTRNPTDSNMEKIQHAVKFKDAIVMRNLTGDRGKLCAQDVSNLQMWSWDDSISSTPGYLTTNGYKEMYDLGSRFHQRFSTLLPNINWYEFRPTLEQRTIKSAEAFIEGLNQGQWLFTDSNATDRDDVLRPYYYCARHNIEVYNGQRSTDEMNKYMDTLEFREMLHRLQNRSGLDERLTSSEAVALYDLCRFDRAFSSTRSSPWCALFTDRDLIILEYLNDIRHYYRNGYGSEINGKLGAPALKNLYENFLSVVSNDSTSITGYFTHDSLMQMVYTALQLFRDYPEVSGFERNEDRKWRTSFMTPFAANFVAVLHKCPTRKQSELYQVQFFINEKEYHLCNARSCNWKQFHEKFSRFLDINLDECNIDKEISPLQKLTFRNVTL
ncbi:unnamed protein product [Diatraea saccharalis]|uniref:Multiple inositol polyphosphate phosphatase 1 n=1 Tax=Diatraea saccharalis TaxID=40085 RepID=A0A9N9QZ56_9NEOP|nr:unnamed protein product [Diatraea saccharalis]